MHEKIAEDLFNASVRLEHLFWIPGICCQPPREFEDFVEDDLPDEKGLLEELPFLKGPLESGWPAEDLMCEFSIRRKNGFIFQAATPKPHNIRKDGSYSSSWGSYYTKWMYADTLEELANKATAWAAEIIAEARAKAA